MDKGVIVFTFDDVIGYTTYKLYDYLVSNASTYGRILDLFHMKTRKELCDRSNENLIYSLLNSKTVDALDRKTLLLLLNYVYASLFQNFYSNPSIWSSLEMSPIADKVLENPIFTETNGIEKILIIFKYRVDKEKEYKNNFILNKFHHPKLEIIPIKIDEKYEDIIQNNITNWNLIVTDNLETVTELAKGDVDHREFLMPKYGYNIAPPELVELIKQKSGTLSYYEIEK